MLNPEYLIVVVPDGLRFGKEKKGYLTNSYRNVLKNAFNFSLKNNFRILLLPANSFGGDKTEEELGRDYLIKKGLNSHYIIIGRKRKNTYLDTYDNFNEVLKNEGEILKERFIVSEHLRKGKYKLFVNKIHYKRTLKVINILNLSTPQEIFTFVAKETRNLPIRLIYYKFPKIHRIYELIAILYLIIKNFFRISKV